MASEAEQFRREFEEMKADLTRLRIENDRLRNELAARPTGGSDTVDKPGLFEGTLFISEVEVRSAIARQLRNGARLLQATKCLYLLFDGNADLVAQRPALGVEEDQLGSFRTPVSRGVSGEVFRTRKPVRVDDTAADDKAGEEPLAQLGVVNGICVPLLVQIRDEENRVIDSKAIGVLWVMNRRGDAPFTDDDERLLTVFARQVAAVVSNAEFFKHLVQQNQTLVSTFENLPAGIVFIGTDERIQLINATARQLFGIPEQRGTGEPYFRVIGHQGTCDLLGGSLRDDEDKIAEVPFTVDEEERVFQIQAARVRGGDDALNGVVAIFDDVTEVHRVDLMKQEFVQTFSTELLGPLASIQGFTTMLERAAPEEFHGGLRREIHQVVNGECDRLRRHIQDLLNVSRHEQGLKIHLNLRRVKLGEMLDRVAHHEIVTARGHQLMLDVPGDLPEVEADAARIEEVCYNLISNAVKYSPDGGRITVRARRAGDGVRVEVGDEGIGIAPELHDQVFLKFTRLQHGDDRVKAGRGIGLFISKFFVESHGGEIGLESEPEVGSTFWFTIPLTPVVEPASRS